ncbi:MAG: hypothetical protein K0S23_3304 [Fluviicola sp.]|jgi:hypothetical protein|nr:hypothetical protein [Fluviicola sp.]
MALLNLEEGERGVKKKSEPYYHKIPILFFAHDWTYRRS